MSEYLYYQVDLLVQAVNGMTKEIKKLIKRVDLLEKKLKEKE